MRIAEFALTRTNRIRLHEQLKLNGSSAYSETTVTREYVPDLMHDFLAGFINRHRADPFYVYYSMANLNSEILPTPDIKPDSRDLYSDNISYLDELIGMLVAELDRLKLRDNTLSLGVGPSRASTRLGFRRAWQALVHEAYSMEAEPHRATLRHEPGTLRRAAGPGGHEGTGVRLSLQSALDNLDPAGGIVDEGDRTGPHES